MTQYSSREPFNDDPLPYRQMMAFRREKSLETASDRHAYVREPRAEFDRPQTNPTNPVLTLFRNQKLAERETVPVLARWWLAFGVPPRVSSTDSEWSHARRVLTRLANLKEES